MHAVLLVAMLATMPDAEAIQKAEALFDDVYGEDLAKARKPDDKAALCENLLEAAEDFEDAPSKYVVLQHACKAAVELQDAGLGLRAAEGLSVFRESEGALEAGNEAWDAARRVRGARGQLEKKLQAAEFYFAALRELEGLKKRAIEMRLEEMEWRSTPSLTCQFVFEFEKTAEGWLPVKHIGDLKVRDGRLVGKITGGDPHVVHSGLRLDAAKCSAIEVCLSVSAPCDRGELFWITEQDKKWGGEKVLHFHPTGDDRLHLCRLSLEEHPAWTGTITAIRLDPGDWDHSAEMDETFTVEFIRGR